VTIWNDPTDETNLLNRPARTENWLRSDEARLRRVVAAAAAAAAKAVGLLGAGEGYPGGELSRSSEDVFDREDTRAGYLEHD
jgi:hypothetical protein